MDQEKQKIKIYCTEFKASPVKLNLESERPTAHTAKGLIWHSDRGSHRAPLLQRGILKSNCRNVVSESLLHTLQTKQNYSTSSLLVGIPSVKEGFFCIIRTLNTHKHTSEQLHQHDITQGMGRKGNCRNNAVSESFVHPSKAELAHHQRYQIGAEAMQDVFGYIASFGNNSLSPEDYKMQLQPA